MKLTTFLCFCFLFNLLVSQPQKAIKLNDNRDKAEILLQDYYAIRTKDMDTKISFNSVQILPFVVHSSWDSFQKIFVNKNTEKETKYVPLAYRESFLKAAIIKTLSTQSTPNKYYPTKGAFHNVLDLDLNRNSNKEPFDKDRIKRICEELPKIAKQIIIFIKDTDGDIAEEHMNNIIGKKWLIKADSQTSSKILERN